MMKREKREKKFYFINAVVVVYVDVDVDDVDVDNFDIVYNQTCFEIFDLHIVVLVLCVSCQ
jgi:hypothetical protein